MVPTFDLSVDFLSIVIIHPGSVPCGRAGHGACFAFRFSLLSQAGLLIGSRDLSKPLDFSTGNPTRSKSRPIPLMRDLRFEASVEYATFSGHENRLNDDYLE